jgi:hypothetical protein
MARREEITKGAVVRGIHPNATVTIIEAKWHGSDVLEVTYQAAHGSLVDDLLCRNSQAVTDLVKEAGRYNAFVASWPESVRLSRQKRGSEQLEMELD